jgi:hypothetical protein
MLFTRRMKYEIARCLKMLDPFLLIVLYKQNNKLHYFSMYLFYN